MKLKVGRKSQDYSIVELDPEDFIDPSLFDTFIFPAPAEYPEDGINRSSKMVDLYTTLRLSTLVRAQQTTEAREKYNNFVSKRVLQVPKKDIQAYGWKAAALKTRLGLPSYDHSPTQNKLLKEPWTDFPHLLDSASEAPIVFMFYELLKQKFISRTSSPKKLSRLRPGESEEAWEIWGQQKGNNYYLPTLEELKRVIPELSPSKQRLAFTTAVLVKAKISSTPYSKLLTHFRLLSEVQIIDLVKTYLEVTSTTAAEEQLVEELMETPQIWLETLYGVR